jgi:hypothetical protein
MKKLSPGRYAVALGCVCAVLTSALGCAPVNDPYGYGGYGGGYGAPPPPPPPAPYYGGGYYGGPGYYGNGNYDRRERERLEQERRRLEEERRRLERERDRPIDRPAPPVARPTQDRCPAGFSPSERKCTQEERRRGCRDMRMPSGLGCVSR